MTGVTSERTFVAQTRLTDHIARYMAVARDTPLSPDVIEKAKHHTLDTIAAMVSGATLPAGVAARSYVAALQGPPDASIVLSGLRTTAIDAALANAMAAHADETDDAHPASITHPGCAVVPSALAMAEATGASGAAFLRAVALGYDLCARFGVAMGAGVFLTDRGFDTHAFGGVFGAAAAAGVLATHEESGMKSILSYAAQQTSGLATLFRDRQHIEKAFVFAGMPARNGVTAAMMVRSGRPGVDDVFDNAPNFFSAFGIGSAQATACFENLGETFEITRTNIKRWSVGSPMQAALDSLETLISTHVIKAVDVASVRVHLPTEGAHVVNDRKMPSVNAQHLAALMLVDGTVGFLSSHDESRMQDPEILDVRRKVTLIPSDELMQAQPARQAIVEIDMKDGRNLSHRTYAVRGTTRNPMSGREVETKAMDLMEPLLGKTRASQTIDAIQSIDAAPSLNELAALIGGSALTNV